MTHGSKVFQISPHKVNVKTIVLLSGQDSIRSQVLTIMIKIFVALGMVFLLPANYGKVLRCHGRHIHIYIILARLCLLRHMLADLLIMEQFKSIQLVTNLFHSSLAHQTSWILKIKHFSQQVAHWTVAR